jgi:hypothetical protein
VEFAADIIFSQRVDPFLRTLLVKSELEFGSELVFNRVKTPKPNAIGGFADVNQPFST